MSEIHRIGTNPRMSMAVAHAGTVYLSGQVALDSIGADTQTQVREVLGRIDALLEQSGSGRDRLLSATVWLTDVSHYEVLNREWDAWLPTESAPARATVISGLALPGLVVEIAVVAAAG